MRLHVGDPRQSQLKLDTQTAAERHQTGATRVLVTPQAVALSPCPIEPKTRSAQRSTAPRLLPSVERRALSRRKASPVGSYCYGSILLPMEQICYSGNSSVTAITTGAV